MKIFSFIFFFILIFQFAFTQKNKVNDEAAIRAARDSSNASIAKHDVDGFANTGCLILYWFVEAQ